MSNRYQTLAQRFAADLEDLAELARDNPADADAIVCALVAHIKAFRPEAVSPLGTLAAPTERIADPREVKS